MQRRLVRAAGLVRPTAMALLAVVRETRLTFLAAAIAYYAFVSAVPLAVVALTVASALGGPALADAVVARLDDVLAPSASEPLRAAIAGGSGRGGATLLGLLVLAWGGLRVFRGLDDAFSLVYGVEDGGSLIGDLRNAAVAAVAGGLGVLGVGALAGVLGGALAGPLAGAVGVLALPGTLAVGFLPLYVVFPGTEMSVREALPGTVLAAVGWTALGASFGAYAAVAGSGSLYGVLGAALLLVTYLYFGAILVLVGAALNAVLGGHVHADTDTDTDTDTGTTPPAGGGGE